MSKAFVTGGDEPPEEEELPEQPVPKGEKNYLTPAGAARLQAELHDLLHRQRPELTAVVAWAAGNGDRSENADYIYGKRRLREIDRRIRFLTKRLENAEIVDPTTVRSEQVFFGATVTVEDEDGVRKTYSIVGIDEADPGRGKISWISPLTRALLRARVGDLVQFRSPKGLRELEILEIQYIEIF
ncbi:MAG: transcription elongation factor GreB [bacterium]